MRQGLVDDVWHKDSRNTVNTILSDYFNGFRLYLKPHKTGYKFYIAVRRHKEHGINDDLLQETPVAYFKDCSLFEAKTKGIEHYQWMVK